MSKSLDNQQKGRRVAFFALLAATAAAAATAIVGPANVGSIISPDEPPVAATSEPAPRSTQSETGTAEPTPTPTPTPTLAPPEQEAVDEAAESASEVVEVINNVLGSEEKEVPTDLSQFASGFVEGEVLAMATEWEKLGYRQVGEAVITEVTLKSSNLEADPQTVELNVCIDSSGIDVLDQNGNSLKESLYNPGHPVLNVYGAVKVDGVWKLTTHEIPTDGNCT